MKDELNTLSKRLLKIGIKTTYIANVPWIYLQSVNGNIVKERFEANHGFTVAWCSIEGIELSNIKEIFKIIRKYR